MSASQVKLMEARDIRLKFADKMVLDGVDFTIHKQEVLVIMGLSGCGKSTLLLILLGLLKPQGGTVFFQDKDLLRLSRSALNKARRHIGMVFQNAALISSMNVGENIGLPIRELTLQDENEVSAIIDQKLKTVGLEEARDKLPAELSGGMQKRAGLARALALDPELVLFDEPSAGLDPVNSGLIDALIIQLREKQQVSSVVVTHEMDSAFAVADRMAFLHEGKMIFEGTPDDFRHSQESAIREFLTSYAKHQSQTGSPHGNK